MQYGAIVKIIIINGYKSTKYNFAICNKISKHSYNAVLLFSSELLPKNNALLPDFNVISEYINIK